MERRLGSGDVPPIVSRETRAQLKAAIALLARWNKRIRLVADADPEVVWSRHVELCLELVPLVPDEAEFGLDLGSGAGFPGLILAIASRRPFHLIERDRRKAAFLQDAARVTEAPVIVHADNIATVALGAAPLITARALAPLAKLLEWSERFRRPETVCLFIKGRSVDQEIFSATQLWQMNITRVPSRTDKNASLLRLSQIRRAR